MKQEPPKPQLPVVVKESALKPVEGGEQHKLEQVAKKKDTSLDVPEARSTTRDLTKAPMELDAAMQRQIDLEARNKTAIPCGGAFRPSILKPANEWTKTSQASLLAEQTTRELGSEELAKERNSACDLLDMLTKSGLLTIEAAELHVVLAPTHCFVKSLLDTLVQDSCNPIEPVERSSVLLASVVHGVPPEELVLHRN